MFPELVQDQVRFEQEARAAAASASAAAAAAAAATAAATATAATTAATAGAATAASGDATTSAVSAGIPTTSTRGSDSGNGSSSEGGVFFRAVSPLVADADEGQVELRFRALRDLKDLATKTQEELESQFKGHLMNDVVMRHFASSLLQLSVKVALLAGKTTTGGVLDAAEMAAEEADGVRTADLDDEEAETQHPTVPSVVPSVTSNPYCSVDSCLVIVFDDMAAQESPKLMQEHLLVKKTCKHNLTGCYDLMQSRMTGFTGLDGVSLKNGSGIMNKLALELTRKLNGEKVVFLECDNCSDNKNENVAVKFAQFLVDMGYVEVCCPIFLYQNHAKNAADRIFGCLARMLKRGNAACVDEMMAYLERVQTHRDKRVGPSLSVGVEPLACIDLGGYLAARYVSLKEAAIQLHKGNYHGECLLYLIK